LVLGLFWDKVVQYFVEPAALRFADSSLQFADFRFGWTGTPKIADFLDSGISPRICGFSICGL